MASTSDLRSDFRMCWRSRCTGGGDADVQVVKYRGTGGEVQMHRWWSADAQLMGGGVQMHRWQGGS